MRGVSLCGGSVKHVPGESIHVTFDRHARQSCDPASSAESRRCPGPVRRNSPNAYVQDVSRRGMPETSLRGETLRGDRTKLRGGGIGATGEAARRGRRRRSRALAAGGSRVRVPRSVARDTNRRGRPRCPSRVKCAISVALPFRTSRAHRARGDGASEGKARSRAAVGEDERGAGGVPEVRLSRGTSRRWWRTWSASAGRREALASPRRSVGYADVEGGSVHWKCTLSVDYKTTVVPGSIRCSAYSPASWRAPVAATSNSCRPDSCSPRRPSSRPPPTATPVASASSRGWIRCA